MDYLTEQQKEIVNKLRDKYVHIHAVLFQRILEKAKDEYELFDILDTIPNSLPLVFDGHNRRLVTPQDIFKPNIV
jgi:hypothetical protein